MPLLKGNIENLLFTGIFSKSKGDLRKIQEKVLINNLKIFSGTEFGKRYNFKKINSIEDYQSLVPIHHYDDVKKLWDREAEGEIGVTSYEKVKTFALSTGTTGKPKLIPLPKNALNKIKRNNLYILSLPLLKNPGLKILRKKILAITGCAKINKTLSGANCGMVSGIMAERASFLLKPLLLPKSDTVNIKDWNEKVAVIASEARSQKIGAVFGIPSAVMAFLNKIKETYSRDEFDYFLKHLEVLFFSGVNYRIYREKIFEILDKEVDIIEYYAASEGVLGHQSLMDFDSMEFFYNNIFFEFIPYKEYLQNNFKDRLLITELERDREYVLIITTGNGAFSYVIGDVVKCIEPSIPLFKITGRTALTINLMGEKTSIYAIEKTVNSLSKELGLSIGEFFVTGMISKARPYYLWVFENNEKWEEKDKSWLTDRLDYYLSGYTRRYKDYINNKFEKSRVVFVEKSVFYTWLENRKTDPGHSKIPRIITDPKIIKKLLKNIQLS